MNRNGCEQAPHSLLLSHYPNNMDCTQYIFSLFQLFCEVIHLHTMDDVTHYGFALRSRLILTQSFPQMQTESQTRNLRWRF